MPAWKHDAFTFRSDSDLAQLALIRAGCGIGWYQSALAARSPALVRVLPAQCIFRLETWVTMHENLRNSPSCKVAFDALVLCLQQHTAARTQDTDI